MQLPIRLDKAPAMLGDDGGQLSIRQADANVTPRQAGHLLPLQVEAPAMVYEDGR